MTVPNLLFIITDQQQAATVDPTSPCLTPNLDALAARGTRFTRCYAANPICSPSRASLFTGLLPHSHGMVDVTHAVPAYRAELQAGLAMWPELLHEAGYQTGYFGKWHVERSNRLENFGFDDYEVEAYHQLQGLVERDDADVRGVVRQPGYKDFLLYGVTDQPVEETPEYQLYSQGIDFLRNAVRDPDRPWALFLSSEAPHDPYVAPRSYFQRYDPAVLPRPVSFDDPLADRPAIYCRIQRVWQDLDWDDYARATDCYYALCTLIDDQIGRVLAVLKELGQLDNTVIVFTSDHGDYMGAHRLMLKGVPAFEEVYRVPLIMAGPDVPISNSIDKTTSVIDIGLTLIELLTGRRFDCQGRSFAPLLRGDAAGWTDEAYAEMQGQRFAYQQRVLWRGQWKYVFNTFDEDELYDLAADPHELHNRAGDPACRPLLESMAGRMWQIIEETDDWNMRQAQYGMFRFAPVGPELTL
ncbi:MAG: sulfatase-like hydrolase/transferase [Anaerolineae bacterium]|nr:sulfatase-like hydrolase/transferase [Anaerolineae bacterium]